MGAKKGLIFGSYPCENWEHLVPFRKDALVVIGADGGLACARSAGFTPHVYVGDGDSGGFPEEGLTCVELPAEKDLTDLQAAYEWAKAQGIREVVFTACTGGRLDHHMSAMGLLERAAKDGIRATLLDSRNHVEFLLPGQYSFSDLGYHYFSLIPVEQMLSGLTIRGAKYPLENRDVLRGDSLTVSNEFADDTVHISFHGGACYFIASN